MRTLALQTSTERASLAFVEGGQTVASRSFDATGRLSQVLIPTLEEMARDAWPICETDLVVTPLGPGSFTGLRVAMAAAKGLAVVAGIPVVAVSSLEALAFASGCPGRTAAVIDARGGLFFYAVYDCSGEFPGEVVPPGLADGEQLAALEVDAFVGPSPPPEVRALMGDRWTSVQADPAAVAALGERAFALRGEDDVTTLRPTYIKRGQV